MKKSFHYTLHSITLEIVMRYNLLPLHITVTPLTSKFRSQGVVRPCPRAIYMYKIMKKLYKIRLQRDFFES